MRVNGVGDNPGSREFQAIYNSQVGTLLMSPAAYDRFYIESSIAGADVRNWMLPSAYASVFDQPATLAFLRGGGSTSGAGSVDYQAVYNSDVGTLKLTPKAYAELLYEAQQAGADTRNWMTHAAYASVFADPATLAFLRGGGTQSQAPANAGLPGSLLTSSLAAANGAGPAIGMAIPQPNWLLIGGAALAIWYFFLRR